MSQSSRTRPSTFQAHVQPVPGPSISILPAATHTPRARALWHPPIPCSMLRQRHVTPGPARAPRGPQSGTSQAAARPATTAEASAARSRGKRPREVSRAPSDAMPYNVRIGARRQSTVASRRARGSDPARPKTAPRRTNLQQTNAQQTVRRPHARPHAPPTRSRAHRILTRPRPPVRPAPNLRRPRRRWISPTPRTPA
jgi:hypothetical protein